MAVAAEPDLLADVARCNGRMATTSTGRVSISVGRAACVRCQRRTAERDPSRPLVFITPPQFEGGKCPQRITP